jgi:hypothetical protein
VGAEVRHPSKPRHNRRSMPSTGTIDQAATLSIVSLFRMSGIIFLKKNQK